MKKSSLLWLSVFAVTFLGSISLAQDKVNNLTNPVDQSARKSQEKAQGESQVIELGERQKHMKEVTASRIRAREESRAAKNALISSRHEHLKQATLSKISHREAVSQKRGLPPGV